MVGKPDDAVFVKNHRTWRQNLLPVPIPVEGKFYFFKACIHVMQPLVYDYRNKADRVFPLAAVAITDQAGDALVRTYCPPTRHPQVLCFQSRKFQYRVKFVWFTLFFLMLDHFLQVIKIDFAFELDFDLCFEDGIRRRFLLLGQSHESQQLRFIYFGVVFHVRNLLGHGGLGHLAPFQSGNRIFRFIPADTPGDRFNFLIRKRWIAATFILHQQRCQNRLIAKPFST